LFHGDYRGIATEIRFHRSGRWLRQQPTEDGNEPGLKNPRAVRRPLKLRP
jgi:hypothetical protein